jgi:hypothetical protein
MLTACWQKLAAYWAAYVQEPWHTLHHDKQHSEQSCMLHVQVGCYKNPALGTADLVTMLLLLLLAALPALHVCSSSCCLRHH